MGKSRNNHYIPQMYLKQWEIDGGIYVYNLLVSHKNVPLWTKKPIKHAGSIYNLYMRIEEGAEYDDLEQYFNQHYESLAKLAFKKACDSGKMTSDDWEKMINYVCLQYVRTLSFYLRDYSIMKKVLPKVLRETCENLQKHLAKENRLIEQKSDLTKVNNNYESLLPISFRVSPCDDDERNMNLEITTVGGKNYWLMSIMQLLDKDSIFYQTIHRFKWSIATAPSGFIWPTSDNPVVLAEEKEQGVYSLSDGIIGKNRFIVFPISPTKILLASEKRRFSFRFEMDIDCANGIKKLIIDNAFRFVFSKYEDDYVVQYRERTEDESLYKEVEEQLNGWYDLYKETEGPYLMDKTIQWES